MVILSDSPKVMKIVDALGKKDSFGARKSVKVSACPIWCGNTVPPAMTSICYLWVMTEIKAAFVRNFIREAQRHNSPNEVTHKFDYIILCLTRTWFHCCPFQAYHSEVPYPPKETSFLCRRDPVLVQSQHKDHFANDSGAYLQKIQAVMPCLPQAVFAAYFM